MTDNLNTSFPGTKIIVGGVDHHLFMAEIIDSPNADPAARSIFVELGTNIDPQTKRAYFDIGNRADNSLTVLSGGNSSNGTVCQDEPHSGYSNFIKQQAVTDVIKAYNDEL